MEKIIAFVNKLIDSYYSEAESNIEEHSGHIDKDKKELKDECENLRKEFLELLKKKQEEALEFVVPAIPKLSQGAIEKPKYDYLIRM